MKLLITFLAGLTVAILLGSADQEDSWSDHLQQGRERIGVYTSTFSGITSDGVCYLAVTNTGNGQTEVIGIPKDILTDITATPLQSTEQGTSIIKLSR